MASRCILNPETDNSLQKVETINSIIIIIVYAKIVLLFTNLIVSCQDTENHIRSIFVTSNDSYDAYIMFI